MASGWQYLPYQVYANSIFGDTVGQSYANKVRPERGPRRLAGPARRVRQRAGLHGQRVAVARRRGRPGIPGRPAHPLTRSPRVNDSRTDASDRPLPLRHRRRPTSCSTGEPHRILAGALHYFRVHPDLWADRIRKARLMGLNTIETYVAVERARAAPRRVRHRRRPRPRPVPRPGRRRGHARDRPARALHLRGVGQRRAAGLAVPRPRGAASAAPSRTTSRRSSEYLRQRATRSWRPRQVDRGRPVHPRADRERVRRVRRRQGLPRRARASHRATPASPCRSPRSTSRRRRCSPTGSLDGLHLHRLVRLARAPSGSRRCASTSRPGR